MTASCLALHVYCCLLWFVFVVCVEDALSSILLLLLLGDFSRSPGVCVVAPDTVDVEQSYMGGAAR